MRDESTASRRINGLISGCGFVKARPELFAAAFDHSAANGKAVFAQFQVLHSALVLIEIVGFAAQGFRDQWVAASQVADQPREAVRMAFKQQSFLVFEPMLSRQRAFAVE